MSEHKTPNGGIMCGDVAPLAGTSQIGDLYGFAPVTTAIPTYFIFNDYKDEVRTKVASADGVLSQFTSYSQSYFESLDAARTQLDTTYQLLRDNIIMLWGDLVHGGVGFMNGTNDIIGLVLHWGAYQDSNGYSFRMQVLSCPYNVQVTNEGAHQQYLNAIVQTTGTYPNGFFFVQGWQFDRDSSSVTMHDWIGYITGAVACNQSYVDESLPIPVYPNVNFYGSIQNVADDFINNFSIELPTRNPIKDKTYWESRALQRKITSLSYVNYEAEPPVEGTSIWGTENEDYSHNPYGPASTSRGGGGYGNQYRYSEPIEDDGVPTSDMLSTGFVALYNPTDGELQDFTDYLFSGITDSIANVIKKMIVNPIDGVISAHMIHTKPTVNALQTIKFCGWDTGCQAYVVSSQWSQILYHIEVSDFYNSYLDNKAYTKIKIFLPYSGIHDIDIDEFIGGDLYVRYKIDLLSGMCVIQIETEKTQNGVGNTRLNSIVYQFTGNCIMQIPLSAIDYRNIINSLISLGTNAVSGNATGAVQSLGGAVTSGISIPKSGQPSTNYGYLGKQQPFIIVEHPEISIPSEFDLFEGYPSNITYKIGEIYRIYIENSSKYKNGIFLSSDPKTVWGNYFHCTDKEADMIKQLFEEGVYLTR